MTCTTCQILAVPAISVTPGCGSCGPVGPIIPQAPMSYIPSEPSIVCDACSGHLVPASGVCCVCPNGITHYPSGVTQFAPDDFRLRWYS